MVRLWAEEGPCLGLSCDKVDDGQVTPVPTEALPQHGQAFGSMWHLHAVVSPTPHPQTLCSAALTPSPPTVPGDEWWRGRGEQED